MKTTRPTSDDRIAAITVARQFAVALTFFFFAASQAHCDLGETLAQLTARYGEGKKNTGKIRMPGHDQYYFEKDGMGVNCVMLGDKCVLEVFHRLSTMITDQDIQDLLKAQSDGHQWSVVVDKYNWQRDDNKLMAYRQLHHENMFFIAENAVIKDVDKASAPKPPPAITPAPNTPPAPHAPTPGLVTPGDFVKSNHSNLLFVKGENGAGSGFIAKIGDANYLVTNAHVAAGLKGATFKMLDGSQLQAATPVVAVDHDIFRLTIPPGGKPLQVMDHVDANAAIGDDIVVLGNAEGAGVVTPITGKILGIGPTLVEVDAPFVPGNSGSPIIHLKTGQVIGVATYAMIRKYDLTTKEPTKEPVVRRFGYRLDSVKTWQPVNWSLFAAQAADMENIEKRTEDLGNLVSDIARTGPSRAPCIPIL